MDTYTNYTYESIKDYISVVSATPELFDESILYNITYSLKDLSPFDAIQVKLVFKSTNACRVPRVKDLRIIACA
jgi:ABC-type multidrug transport system fused ATPase/permease subunit